MDVRYKEEEHIYQNKLKVIDKEIERKKQDEEKFRERLIQSSKEARGAYSQEKEINEKLYELIKKEVDKIYEVRKNPYFGRIDFREYKGMEESLYIGKQGIMNPIDGEEIIVDWRAPVADIYYSGSGGHCEYLSPSGIIEGELSLKRKFKFEDGKINKIFDESINELIIGSEEGKGLIDEYLKINLEESRGKKLKEVVATIQEEQNRIIRWPKNLPIVIQGAAGSGKTTIALHRLAYLIYRYKESLKGEDILVLAPNKIFLNYISDILPHLGVNKVPQFTFYELIKKLLKLKGKIYTKDDKLKEVLEAEAEKRRLIEESTKVKGSLLFKDILDRYINIIGEKEYTIDDIRVENQILFNKKEIARLYTEDLKNLPLNKRKDEIKRYLNLKIKDKIKSLVNKVEFLYEFKVKDIKKTVDEGDERRKILISVYDERDEIKRSIIKNSKKALNDYFKIWRGIEPKDIFLQFINDIEIVDNICEGKIPKDTLDYIREDYREKYEKNIIDEDDMQILLYIYMKLEGLEGKKFKHIVVDEAQDYSPFQIYLINTLTKGNSLTLVGDIAQGIYYYKGIEKWEDVTKGVFTGESTFISLSQSYRSTVEIIEYAERALEKQKLHMPPCRPVLRHGMIPEEIKIEKENEIVGILEKIEKKVKDEGKSSIAIIVKTIEEGKVLKKLLNKTSKNKYKLLSSSEEEFDGNYGIIPVHLTKGLEFDATIIYNPSEENYGENLLDMRLLYVALTRALHFEYIIIKDKISRILLK